MLVPLVLLVSFPAGAGCLPVPAPWGFAIACTLDRHGTGTGPKIICSPTEVESASSGGAYEMSGKCELKVPVERTVFFRGEATSEIFVPVTAENTQESVKLFADAAHSQELGRIQGIYTCQDDPFLDAGATCETESYATTVENHDVLLEFQPLMRGLAGGEGSVGTSQSELQAPAPLGFAGIWREGQDGYYLWRAKGWSNFVDKWKELSPLGLRLVDIESFKSGSDVYFTGVWREGSDGHYLWHARSWQAFTDKWKELAAKNLRLTSIETYIVNDERRYVGIWRQGADAYYLWNTKGWKAFTDKWKELNDRNYRLVDIETYPAGDDTGYIGVWRGGSDRHYLWNVDSWEKLVAKWKELAPRNYRLIDIDIRRSGGKTHYIGVWREGSDGYALWHSRTWKGMVAKWKELGAENLRLMNLAIR